MRFVSFIGASHNRVEGYAVSNLAGILKDSHPERIIVAIDPEFDHESGEYLNALNTILKDPDLKDLVSYANVDEGSYFTKRIGYLEEYSKSAETVVKRNIMEMIETTIKSYLEGYWKDSETVNSDVTDALFRAKHKLISTMFWEMEKNTWNEMLEKMTARISEHLPSEDDIILVDVEKKYWLLDEMGSD